MGYMRVTREGRNEAAPVQEDGPQADAGQQVAMNIQKWKLQLDLD